MSVVQDFLPHGCLRHQDLHLRALSLNPPDLARNQLATYHFGMFLDHFSGAVGSIDLRLGDDHDTNHFGGQIGYGVHPDHRGRGLAARSLRLLVPLARKHGFEQLWVTCDPDNQASRRTCERAGAILHEILDIPVGHAMYARGIRQKCRFRLDLALADGRPAEGF